MRKLAKLGPGPGAYSTASDVFADGDEDEFSRTEESKREQAILRRETHKAMRSDAERIGGGGGLGRTRGQSRGGRRDRKAGVRKSSMFRSKTTRFVPKKSTTVSQAVGTLQSVSLKLEYRLIQVTACCWNLLQGK